MFRYGVVVLAILVVPRLTLASPDEPRGFGKARFGMSPKEVVAVFPQLKLVGGTPQVTGSLALSIYALENQSYLGLKPCQIGFRFFAEQLYEITFECGNSPDVLKALKKQFGEPGPPQQGAVYWQQEHTVIGMIVASSNFSLVDRALNNMVQAALLRYVLTQQGKAQPAPANPTPAAPPQ